MGYIVKCFFKVKWQYTYRRPCAFCIVNCLSYASYSLKYVVAMYLTMLSWMYAVCEDP